MIYFAVVFKTAPNKPGILSYVNLWLQGLLHCCNPRIPFEPAREVLQLTPYVKDNIVRHNEREARKGLKVILKYKRKLP